MKLQKSDNMKAGQTAASIAGVLFATATLGIYTPQLALAQVDEDLSDPDLIIDDDFSPDDSPPSVRILSPSACSNSITSAGPTIVSGIASDPESGIRKVEAFSHTYPFDGTFPFKIATPSSAGDWSSWTIPVQIYENSTRILVRATDNSGNENWDEVKVDMAQSNASNYLDSYDASSSVAFVDPAFTDAAYGVGGFYEFYAKYHGTSFDELITTDLDLMIADISANPDKSYYHSLVERVQSSMQPGSKVTILSDMDVHDGVIFGEGGDNAFKALFLMHNEYVTQQEYDNLKRFVYNGGTLVFIDSNAFYAEVSYDKAECNVTLVKGHDWEFNGEFARRGMSERYQEENKEWAGTNYMINALWDPVSFKNIPFNYSHFEENYISNPNATILHDYGLHVADDYDGPDWHKNATIAAYEMTHGNGRIIGMGIYGQNLAKDPQFLDFFDRVILVHALGNQYIVTAADSEYHVYWKMKSGQVTDILVDSESSKLVITLQGSVDLDTLQLALPKELIETQQTAPDGETGLHPISVREGELATLASTDGEAEGAIFSNVSNSGTFIVTAGSIDGGLEEVRSNELSEYQIDHERIIEFPVKPGTSKIEIHGAYVAPEFGLYQGFAFVAAGLGLASLVLMRKFPWVKRLL